MLSAFQAEATRVRFPSPAPDKRLLIIGGKIKWLKQNLKEINHIANVGTIGHVDHGKNYFNSSYYKNT